MRTAKPHRIAICVQRRNGRKPLGAKRAGGVLVRAEREEHGRARGGCRGGAQDGAGEEGDAGCGLAVAGEVAAAAAEFFVAAWGEDGDGDAGVVAEAAELQRVDRDAYVGGVGGQEVDDFGEAFGERALGGGQWGGRPGPPGLVGRGRRRGGGC